MSGARTLFLTVAALAATSIVPSPAVAQQGPVVTVAWLADHLADPDLVVLHVGDAEGFATGHVAGARLVTLQDISAPMPPGDDHENHLTLELPEASVLRATLEGLGISDDSRVAVVPTARSLTQAARVVFTLDAAGFGDRTVLVDGGLEAWTAAGQPLTVEVDEVVRGRITREMADRVVSAEWVQGGGATAQGYSLLDGRNRVFYEGGRADRGKVGHIPGARSMPAPELFETDPETGAAHLKPLPEIEALFEEAGVGADDTVVAYCHIGQYATVVLLAARMLGHDVRLYDGSMNEWAIQDRPTEGGGAG